MPKVLVLFHSRTGNTAALADAIAEGAASVKFTEVEIRRVDDLAPAAVVEANEDWKRARAALAKKYRTLESVDSLADYDALIVGSPTRFGGMSAEVKSVLDRAEALWTRGALVDKVGSAFSTVGTPHGGHETTIQSILVPMMHYGMIIVPPGYAEPGMFSGGSPYGATATGTGGAPVVSELAVARHQGARVARVAEWVRHAKSHKH
ncbi:MAG: NAD(P)H:quinone oxidoreductase [Gemmatimonadaceae bacterium]|nr:NAD(P)H:quinone oxidoreductase [Gemmatimonadaceae bacterium]